MELVPENVNEKDLREEVHRRTARAGYTTKYGEPPFRTKIMSMPFTEKGRENYVKIFGHD
jgi:hypothetical protein